MMSKELPLQLVFENDPKQLVFANTENSVVALSIKNEDTRTAYGLKINVVRGDLLLAGDLTLEDDSKIGGGEKVISGKWVECRLASPDAWQPVDDWATGFELGDLAPGASIAFEIRINLPTGNTDIGRMCFAIQASAASGEDLRVTSVVIDQAGWTLTTGDTTTATVTVSADVGVDDSVNWSSSNSGAATITNAGLITAVAPGTSVIEAVSVVNSLARSSRFVVVSHTG